MSYVQKDDASSNAFIVNLSYIVQNYTMTGLRPTTTYTVQLFASTRVGRGPSRSADVQTAVTPGYFVALLARRCQVFVP